MTPGAGSFAFSFGAALSLDAGRLLDLLLQLLGIDAGEKHTAFAHAAAFRTESEQIQRIKWPVPRTRIRTVRRSSQRVPGATGVNSAQPMRIASVGWRAPKQGGRRRSLDFASTPGRGLVDVFVAVAENRYHIGAGVGNFVMLVMVYCVRRTAEERHTAASASTSSRSPAAGTVPSKYWRIIAAVRETRLPRMLARIGVGAGSDGLEADVAVVLQRQLAEQVIADGVQPEEGDQVVAVNDIALGFAHLIAVEQQPRIASTVRGSGSPSAIRMMGQ